MIGLMMSCADISGGEMTHYPSSSPTELKRPKVLPPRGKHHLRKRITTSPPRQVKVNTRIGCGWGKDCEFPPQTRFKTEKNGYQEKEA
jgi:hypothetical protein